MRIKKYPLSIYILTSFIGLASCKKFLDIKPAPDMLVTQEVFATDDAAISAITGLYGTLSQSQRVTSGGLSIYASLSADDLSTTTSSSTTDAFLFNALTANDNTVNLNFYNFSYKAIYQCNTILDGLAKSTTLSTQLRNQLTGEAKVIRSLLYFYLVNLFGDVPLVTVTDYKVSASLPRSPVQDVYKQIVSDLKEAESLLSNTYPSTGKARPNRMAAMALLARVALYIKDYATAESECTTILLTGVYALTSLASVFTNASTESIWELVSDLGNTTEGAVFVPLSSTTRPRYQITPSLLSAFESGDGRRSSWIGSSIVSGVTYYYPNKYKLRTSSTIGESNKILRLSELYLVRAEARAEQNNLSGALADLNIIRSRAGLPNSVAVTKEEILSAIEKERRNELFAEWGHRWFDLKRRNKADSVLSVIKGNNWQSTDALYPIPLKEILVNPLLTQNPGY